MADLPIIHCSKVFHIGTLNKKDKNIGFDYSYEANCLSVSVTPHAWKQIIKSGDSPLNELTKENGVFLDILEFRNSSSFQEAIDWAAGKNLIKTKDAYQAWYFDDEMNAWMFTYFDTLEEAIEEIDTYEEYDGDISLFPYPEDEDCAIKLTKNYEAQDALFELLQHKKTKLIDINDFIIIAYAQEVLDVDGLWWNYPNNPNKHTAPCGGIVPKKISEWEIKEINIQDINDAESLINFTQENSKDYNFKNFIDT